MGAHTAKSSGLTLAVPTFRRARLLARLLEDVSRQTRPPDRIVVVDGEGGAHAVRDVCAAARAGSRTVELVRSTHANLPFQRYLGWLASRGGTGVLLYLDDDLRLPDPTAFERLVRPLEDRASGVAATTAPIRYPDLATDRAPGNVVVRLRTGRKPGGVTPGGHRIPAAGRAAYAPVDWLRGGVMALRASVLTPDCFPADLFALAERGWGLGEDLLLAARIRRRGRILLARQAVIEHPNADATRSFRTATLQHSFAAAYSRRLLNDFYRGDEPPRAADRLRLAGSYAAQVARAGLEGRPTALAGFAAGALRGWFDPPRARRLTPGVDWQDEARRALGG